MSGHVDRSQCPAERHDSMWDYHNRGCRCPDRRAEFLRYRKLRDNGRIAPRLVPAFRVERRLQGLCAIGWSATDLMPHMNVGRSEIQKLRHSPNDRASVRSLETVSVVYDKLSGTPGPTDRCRGWAFKFGWFPPLAWDDIDDPDEVPSLGADGEAVVDLTAVHLAIEGRKVRLTGQEREVAVLALKQRGKPDREIGARVGITERHVARIVAKARLGRAAELGQPCRPAGSGA